MVPHVLDEFEPDEVFALTDAVYFDGAWTEPFDPANTEPRPFTRPDGDAVDGPDDARRRLSSSYFEDDDRAGRAAAVRQQRRRCASSR